MLAVNVFSAIFVTLGPAIFIVLDVVVFEFRTPL